VFILALSASSGPWARIEAPDHVIYGSVTVFGDPAAPGQRIRATRVATGEVLASYELGRDQRLGDLYALRIPMDAVDPRVTGRARPGDPIDIYIAGELAGQTSVGKEGTAVRLDIDPQNLGTGPSVEVFDAQLFEGNAGLTFADFAVEMSTTSEDNVTVSWSTRDGTATGGPSCASGIDYVSESASLVISPGAQQATIRIDVCGDSVIEGTETFELDIGVQRGVSVRESVTATIIGDDDVPTLLLSDIVVTEPTVGATATAVFKPSLSKNSDFEARFDYRVSGLNARDGVHFEAVSGTATIPAGDIDIEIEVPLLHAPSVDEPRSFVLSVSSPFNLNLSDRSALGVIQDPDFEPAVEHEQAVANNRNGVTRLAGPTALALSPDGAHAYVTSQAMNAVLAFRRSAASGHLSLLAEYSTESAGFESALLSGPLDVAVSPDGAHVYVAAKDEDAIAVFARSATGGTLTFVGNTTVAQTPTPLDGVRQLLVSGDGAHVYAAGADANTLAVFARDSAGGTLTLVESEVNATGDPDDAGAAVVGMERPQGLALSVDGMHLYVASRFGNAVQWFAREADADASDYGRLEFRDAYVDGLDSITDLGGAYAVAVSGDGEHVYVSAEDENAVVLFDRNADGSLSQRAVWRHDPSSMPGLRGAQGLAVAPDGLEVFTVGRADHSLSLFERIQPGNTNGQPPGDLRLRQTVFDDAGAVLNMAGPTAVVPSADDEHLYVVANEDDAIVVFRRISVDEVFSNDFE
jgi:6-phosphogluconolactonase (cycloisomerase 2 family)